MNASKETIMGKLEVLWVRRSTPFKLVSTFFVVATVAATMGQYSGPKLWWEAGDTENLPLSESFPDRTGELLLYNYDGPVAARHNSFFQPLGTNGRACVTCHQPSNAMSLSTDTLQERWKETEGKDPVFAAIDGSNCPTLPQSQKSSHSLLLQRGLFRIYLPWPTVDSSGTPIKPEFTIEVVRDPTGCNTDPVYGLNSAQPTISVYRRPRMVANLKFVLGTMDGFDMATSKPSGPVNSGALTADGREATLESQAINAVFAHEQGKRKPDPDQLQDILDFERQIFIAQGADKVGGDLTEVDGPQVLGTWNLARAVLPAAAKSPYQAVFFTSNDWRPSSNTDAKPTPQSEFRASVVRGNRLFSSRMFTILETANLTDHPSGKPIEGTCSTCHKAALVGTDPTRGWMDVGTTIQPTANSEDSPDLPLFKITCSATALPRPYRGRVIYTTDPGRALTTGKCSDVGSVVMQQFRGLSARAPYFSNGSAKDLGEVVDFYDRRFKIHLSVQEKQDLINFMSVL
jgi:hypothetical protein